MKPTSSSLAAEMLFRLRGGPLRTARWLLERLTDTRHDRQFGIATAERWDRVRLGFASQDSIEYQAIGYREISEIFALLRPGPDDVFIDLGSGMGRVVCMAATLPMRAVIGVEISDELHRRAERNLQSLREPVRARSVHFINVDATTYEIAADATIIFLFNPFIGDALLRVLANIERSAQSHPRKFRLVFAGTRSAEDFEEIARLYPVLRLASRTRLTTGFLAFIYDVGA